LGFVQVFPPLEEPQVPSVVGLEVAVEVADELVVDVDECTVEDEERVDEGELDAGELDAGWRVVVWCGTLVSFTGATQ
jgi:hypothetical protein